MTAPKPSNWSPAPWVVRKIPEPCLRPPKTSRIFGLSTPHRIPAKLATQSLLRHLFEVFRLAETVSISRAIAAEDLVGGIDVTNDVRVRIVRVIRVVGLDQFPVALLDLFKARTSGYAKQIEGFLQLLEGHVRVPFWKGSKPFIFFV